MIRIHNTIYTFLLAFALPLLFIGCVDNTFRDFGMDYGDGISDLKVNVEFKNLSPALETLFHLLGWFVQPQ